MASILKVDQIVDINETGSPDFPNGVSIGGNKLSGIPGYNYIINGNFDIWQRGTYQTIGGYGSDDRWSNNHSSTSTKTHARQAFPKNSTANAQYYSSTHVTSGSGASDFCLKCQKIEGVRTLAGKKATLAFYASGTSGGAIGIEFLQHFGTGGTPSGTVPAIGAKKVQITTELTRYVVTVDIPSIADKTLGTNGDDSLEVRFWFSAGSAHAVQSSNIGIQSGVFVLAWVSLVEGDVDIKPIPRSYGEELALCQRYYIKNVGVGTPLFNPLASGYERRAWVAFPVKMRTVPGCTVYVSNIHEPGLGPVSVDGARVFGAVGGDVETNITLFHADAEL